MPKLIKLESAINAQKKEIIQVDSGNILIGRDDNCTVVVKSDALSRRHGGIFEAGSQWVFRDMGSTNGSWVNGVQVRSGQVRLLRGGDIIQLADFPIKFIENSSSGYDQSLSSALSAEEPSSILVFAEGRFQTEFPLISNGSRFVLGGPEGDFYLENQPTDLTLLEILFDEGVILLSVFSSEVSCLINGIAITGQSELHDKDEIDVGLYKFVISDPRVVTSDDKMHTVGAGTSPKNVRDVDTVISERPISPELFFEDSFQGPLVEEQVIEDSEPYEEPQEEIVEDRTFGRKKQFVFGSGPLKDELDSSSTMHLGREGVGFELSASQRFAAILDEKPKSNKFMTNKIIAIFGGILFVILISFIVLILK